MNAEYAMIGFILTLLMLELADGPLPNGLWQDAAMLIHHPAMQTVRVKARGSSQAHYYRSVAAQKLVVGNQPFDLLLDRSPSDTLVLRWEQFRSDQLKPLILIQMLDRRARSDTIALWFEQTGALPIDILEPEVDRIVLRTLVLPVDTFPVCFNQSSAMWVFRVDRSGKMHCYGNIKAVQVRRVTQRPRQQ